MRNQEILSAYSERLSKSAITVKGAVDDIPSNPHRHSGRKISRTNFRLNKKIKKRGNPNTVPEGSGNSKRQRFLNMIAYNSSATPSETKTVKRGLDMDKESEFGDRDDNCSNIGLVSNANDWEKMSSHVSTQSSIDAIQSKILKLQLNSWNN